MTKSIRIENADTSDYKVVVEVWQVGYGSDGGEKQPDTLIKTTMLEYPTALTTELIHSGQYLVVKELVKGERSA